MSSIEGLGRRERIRRRPEFLRVQQGGSRTRGRYLTLFARANSLGINRLGIVAPRRLGGAVTRNRSKRLVREIYRQNKPQLGERGIDFVVLPRPEFSTAPFAALQADFVSAVRRHERAR